MLYCASNWTHIRNFHLPYIKFFSTHGYEVHVAASGIPLDADLPVIQEMPFQKKIASLHNIKVLVELIRLLKKEQYETVYVHTSLAAFFCRLAIAFSNIRQTRLVYLCHGYFFVQDNDGTVEKDFRSLFYLLCEKLLASHTDTLLLMNLMDYASANRYKLGKKIEFVHGMGLMEEKYPPINQQDAEALRRSWEIPQEAVVYSCVGEFSKRKNQKLIIEAFAKIQEKKPDRRLLFAGDGTLLEQCRELVGKYRLEDKVIFCGQVQDIRDIYAVTDVLVTASKSEGLPFCVMEALHYGIPVIASKIKGHTDLIVYRENGTLFDLDKDDLASFMEAYAGASAENIAGKHDTLGSTYYYKAVLEEILCHGGFEVETAPLAQ